VAVGVGAAVLVASCVAPALPDGDFIEELEGEGVLRPEPVALGHGGAESSAVLEVPTLAVAGAVPPHDLVGSSDEEASAEKAAVPVPSDALGVPEAAAEADGEPVSVPFSADAVLAAEEVGRAAALRKAVAVAHGVAVTDTVALPGDGTAEAESLFPLPLGDVLGAGLRDEERVAAAVRVGDWEGDSLRE
jgi:hypothetical protein